MAKAPDWPHLDAGHGWVIDRKQYLKLLSAQNRADLFPQRAPGPHVAQQALAEADCPACKSCLAVPIRSWKERYAHANQVPGAIQHHTPQLPCLSKPPITGIGSENQQKTESKRRNRQRYFHCTSTRPSCCAALVHPFDSLWVYRPLVGREVRSVSCISWQTSISKDICKIRTLKLGYLHPLWEMLGCYQPLIQAYAAADQ